MYARWFDERLCRFAVVGVLNSGFGYLAYATMLGIGLGYAAASAVSMAMGVLFNFKTTGSLVFGSNDNRLIVRFVGVYGVVYAVNYLGLWLLEGLGVDPYTAGLMTLLPAAGLAFLLNKFFVFRLPPRALPNIGRSSR